jgi:ribosome-binding factor A
MASYRRGRVNEAVTNEVSQIAREIKDPRLAGLMITITGSDVSPDLKFSKIFYSVIGEHDPKETAKALKSGRRSFAHSLQEGSICETRRR